VTTIIRDWHRDFDADALDLHGPGSEAARDVARFAYYSAVLQVVDHVATTLLDGPGNPEDAINHLLDRLRLLALECREDLRRRQRTSADQPRRWPSPEEGRR
jgi:hypothetical protein